MYDDFAYFYKIYVRQGQAADYLIDPTDVSANSSQVRRFAPLNLTAERLTNTTDYVQVYRYGTSTAGTTKSAFVEYPSQTGAMFQWQGSTANQRYAWHPTKSLASWPVVASEAPTVAWNANLHETCPSGYRRPTSAAEGAATTSEVALSLISDYSTLDNAKGNALWGYYADGFFDRRPVTANTSVEAANHQVAHVGWLFYNNMAGSNSAYASLFFPASGHRNWSNGAYESAGSYGNYWTSSTSGVGGTVGTAYQFSSGAIRYNLDMSHGQAMPVRCVAN